MSTVTDQRLRELAELFADAGVEGVYEALYALRHELGGRPATGAEDRVPIYITVAPDTAADLRALTRSSALPNGTLGQVIEHLVHSAADGVRRPGAWERGWLEQAFGDFDLPGQPDRIDEIDLGDECFDCSGPIVHVHEPGTSAAGGPGEGSWYCACCDREYLASIDPRGLAVVALLTFAAQCFTPLERDTQLELRAASVNIDDVDADACPMCGGPYVHVIERTGDPGYWACGYHVGVDPAGLAAASLIAFAIRCFTPREEDDSEDRQARCLGCGHLQSAHNEARGCQVIDECDNPCGCREGIG